MPEETMTNLDSVLKSRDITLPTKFYLVKAMVFPVVMYGCVELEHKKGWALKNWCFGTVVLQKTSESPSDSKEIKPVNPKGNQPWIYIGKNEAEAPIFCHLMQRASSLEKTLMKRLKAGGGSGTEDEMVRQHHWLSGHKFEQTLGDSEGQRSLARCSSWSHKESDMR